MNYFFGKRRNSLVVNWEKFDQWKFKTIFRNNRLLKKLQEFFFFFSKEEFINRQKSDHWICKIIFRNSSIDFLKDSLIRKHFLEFIRRCFTRAENQWQAATRISNDNKSRNPTKISVLQISKQFKKNHQLFINILMKRNLKSSYRDVSRALVMTTSYERNDSFFSLSFHLKFNSI